MQFHSAKEREGEFAVKNESRKYLIIFEVINANPIFLKSVMIIISPCNDPTREFKWGLTVRYYEEFKIKYSEMTRTRFLVFLTKITIYSY